MGSRSPHVDARAHAAEDQALGEKQREDHDGRSHARAATVDQIRSEQHRQAQYEERISVAKKAIHATLSGLFDVTIGSSIGRVEVVERTRIADVLTEYVSSLCEEVALLPEWERTSAVIAERIVWLMGGSPDNLPPRAEPGVLDRAGATSSPSPIDASTKPSDGQNLHPVAARLEIAGGAAKRGSLDAGSQSDGDGSTGARGPFPPGIPPGGSPGAVTGIPPGNLIRPVPSLPPEVQRSPGALNCLR